MGIVFTGSIAIALYVLLKAFRAKSVKELLLK